MTFDRRSFIRSASLGMGALLMPEYSTPTLFNAPDKKLGIALVGLGNYSRGRLAPALEETEHVRLAGIVTGTPAKEKEWGERYDIPAGNIYNYDNFDKIVSNDDIDIVYIVLPNAMHAEFSIRGAKAGKHVICEKPMATSVRECEAMIKACDDNNVKLQLGYRLLYEPNTREFYRYAHKNVLGEVRSVESSNAFYASDGWDNWRFHGKLSGGGPLMDMGVYSLHAVRHVMGTLPKSITAQSYSVRPKFKTIEETILWQMHFDNGIIANCMSSYSARVGGIEVHADQGSFRLDSAFGYGPVKMYARNEFLNIRHTNHQAVQMDAFAKNILNETSVLSDGMEGLKDMKIIEAIYQAAKTGKKVMV